MIRNRTSAMLGAGLTALLACTGSAAIAQGAGVLRDLPAVALPTLERSEIAALVLAGQETTLSSQMPGKILRVRAGLGEPVQAGATLVEFDCSEQEAQLAAAEAEYKGARETHLSRMRLQALGAAGELEVTLAASAAEKARSQIELRQSQMAYCVVKAPFGGQVARVRVKAAESVQLGQPLVELVNPATLKTQMFVPGSWVGWVKPRMPFEVVIRETGKAYRARVSKINARVEGVSQQLEVEGQFERGVDGLLPGMVGAARFADAPGVGTR